MNFLIGFLTFVLVIDCLLLILLILIQLPKKEAGLGQAFGASATDALFGAGSGTVLTKVTKYAATFFLAVTFLLAILNANAARSRGKSFEKQLQSTKIAETLPATPAPGTTTPPAPAAATNVAAPAATTGAAPGLKFSATNAPATAATNAPVKPPAEAPK